MPITDAIATAGCQVNTVQPTVQNISTGRWLRVAALALHKTLSKLPYSSEHDRLIACAHVGGLSHLPPGPVVWPQSLAVFWVPCSQLHRSFPPTYSLKTW